MGKQSALLNHVSNPPTQRADDIGCDQFIVELDRAGVGLNQTNDQAKQRRFAAATWPNKNGGLAAFDGKICRMQRRCARVVLAYIDKVNKGAHYGP